MIFQFTVNNSFLVGSGHPITIPKSQLPYQKLASAGLNHQHVIVILPHGERFKAAIYHGEAGYGEYYQLRFTGTNRKLPSYLKVEYRLIVVLVKTAKHSYAILEFSE